MVEYWDGVTRVRVVKAPGRSFLIYSYHFRIISAKHPNNGMQSTHDVQASEPPMLGALYCSALNQGRAIPTLVVKWGFNVKLLKFLV